MDKIIIIDEGPMVIYSIYSKIIEKQDCILKLIASMLKKISQEKLEDLW